MDMQLEGDFARVELSTPLPCGIQACGTATTNALVEQDPIQSGLWSLLPICPRCVESIRFHSPASRHVHVEGYHPKGDSSRG